MKVDNVNHPPHYKQGDVECIDAIASCLGEGFKFLWRYQHKGKVQEDLDKSIWYINKLKSVVNE